MFDIAGQISLLPHLTATTPLGLHGNANRGGFPKSEPGDIRWYLVMDSAASLLLLLPSPSSSPRRRSLILGVIARTWRRKYTSHQSTNLCLPPTSPRKNNDLMMLKLKMSTIIIYNPRLGEHESRTSRIQRSRKDHWGRHHHHHQFLVGKYNGGSAGVL